MQGAQGKDTPILKKETIQYMLSNSTGVYVPAFGGVYSHGFIVDYAPCQPIFGEDCVYYLGSEGSLWVTQYYMAPKANRIFIISSNAMETIGSMAGEDAMKNIIALHPELLS